MPSAVNGANGAVIHAPDKPTMNQTVNFYTNLVGFTVKSEKASSAVLLAKDKLTTMRIDLSDEITPQEIADLKDNWARSHASVDWRSQMSHLTFAVTDLNDIVSALMGQSVPCQMYPNELYPSEVYAIDPLGNLVGFTSAHNALSLIPPVSKLTIDEYQGTTMSSAASEVSRILGDEHVSRNIAVMTSGGDAPGMNAFVRAVVRAAIFRGCKPFAIMEGYEGLVRGGPDYIKEMHWQDVRGYLTEGGTKIGTARCMAFKERAGRMKACKNMIAAGIDALIVCGGDGSLTGADLFRSEWPSLIKELLEIGDITQQEYTKHKHLNICGAVGSIDNDMATTDATIGAYSALDRICRAIDYIDATANSHSRAFVIEVMGRHCGWLALMAGIATSADYIFIPEKPSSSKDWRAQMKTIVILAEGAITSDLQPISANEVKDVLAKSLGLDTRVTTLGHVQRGGNAVAYDRIIATFQGVEAVRAVLESSPDTPSPLIGVKENKIVRLSLVDAVKITKSVAAAIEKHDFAKAMDLRDSEFVEHLHNFMAINSANHEQPSLPKEQRRRIAIINVGAPAGGMNSAVYAMATYSTISNNVPGTDYSLGSDTCLNSLMEYCDVVKQSASATRDRAFVIDVQGGNSGYIATFASLACGAQASYVPEEGIDLAQLELDIKSLKESFTAERGLARTGKLLLKSTNASKVLTTEVLAEIFKSESDGVFDTKTAIPGHVQQGGLPSPVDRTRATRFAVKAVQFIEDNSDVISNYRDELDFAIDDKQLSDTAAVLGIVSSHLRFQSIRQLYDFETEVGRRMPKRIHWARAREIADSLVGRTKITKKA
ncbi:6-phosphofructokinase subunit beta [Candidozyma auris]|nr:6-phosphofructokinase subunit beta [[Candida] auris]